MTIKWIKAQEQLPDQNIERVIIKTPLGYIRMHAIDFCRHCSLRQEWVQYTIENWEELTLLQNNIAN